jgi:hypothetical protein
MLMIVMSVGYVLVSLMAMTFPVLILRPAARAGSPVRWLDYVQWFLTVAIIGAGLLAIFQLMFWPAITSPTGAR